MLRGRDVLAAAVTASGKTAAFLLPILHGLLGKPRGIIRALVVAPTRELAAQIAEPLRHLAGQTGLTGAAVHGGVAMGPQVQAFRKGVDVLIATPGRLLDHLQYPYARLDSLEYLVLDEADRHSVGDQASLGKPRREPPGGSSARWASRCHRRL